MYPLEKFSKTVFPIYGVPRDGDKVTRVAIIGSGAAGISAAWTLHNTPGFEFDVYEKNDRVGGHSYTYHLPQEGGGSVPVDMGFIFGHHYSYSNMLEMMKKAGVKEHRADLSLAVNVDGCEWRTNAIDNATGVEIPGKMHPVGRAECDRFMALCERNFNNPAFNLIPFDWVLKAYGFGDNFKKLYLSPVLITLFITENGLYGYSSRFMFNMFAGPNKFVDLRTLTECFTITGGTELFSKKISEPFQDRIRVNCPVKAVRRIKEGEKNKVLVESKDGIQIYDHVIMATGALVSSMLLKNKSKLEKFVFNQIRYETAVTTLHTDDKTYIPNDGNGINFFHKRKGDHIELTGNMAEVQQKRRENLNPVPVLTLDPFKEIDPKKVLHTWSGAVHVQDMRHLITSRILGPMIQGNGNVWYGNSWNTWMGHAAAVDAGLLSASRIGGNWQLSTDGAVKTFADDNARDMFGDRFDPYKHTRPIKAKL